ncbi:hypothetical protein FGK63_12975 [Ruegeria sediminis]|uniref:Uncharacterized protein n=1 Tax=Ruegeria sediminis TaxID=2583820 RepID=A0ABY2WX86_9RHOB|nr:hypothetical protein [Ruegeria sediminis]TMV07021.1 hypothetical protein FGK63_12975 [Ruegeria sediminis]
MEQSPEIASQFITGGRNKRARRGSNVLRAKLSLLTRQRLNYLTFVGRLNTILDLLTVGSAIVSPLDAMIVPSQNGDLNAQISSGA